MDPASKVLVVKISMIDFARPFSLVSEPEGTSDLYFTIHLPRQWESGEKLAHVHIGLGLA